MIDVANFPQGIISSPRAAILARQPAWPTNASQPACPAFAVHAGHARAGEQGRGFAVVAGEVRNLAQRSAAAAKEIKSLIDDSVTNVEAGAKQVDRAGATMGEIVRSIEHVTGIMADIAHASEEQSAGIEQVNSAIVDMDAVTQQNAALVEQAAAAAESMQDQAERLAQVVSTFTLDEAGGATPRPRPAAPSQQLALAPA